MSRKASLQPQSDYGVRCRRERARFPRLTSTPPAKLCRYSSLRIACFSSPLHFSAAVRTVACQLVDNELIDFLPFTFTTRTRVDASPLVLSFSTIPTTSKRTTLHLSLHIITRKQLLT